MTKLKRLAGGDRSNLRRAVRSLLRWELVEEATAGGERHVRLTFWGVLMVMLSLKPEEPMIVTQGKQAGEDR